MKDYFKTNYDFLVERSDVLKAIAHPVRLCILKGLCKYNECQVSDIVESLNIPQSTISQHISILKKAGLIKGRRDGVNIYYSLTDPNFKEAIDIILDDIN